MFAPKQHARDQSARIGFTAKNTKPNVLSDGVHCQSGIVTLKDMLQYTNTVSVTGAVKLAVPNRGYSVNSRGLTASLKTASVVRSILAMCQRSTQIWKLLSSPMRLHETDRRSALRSNGRVGSNNMEMRLISTKMFLTCSPPLEGGATYLPYIYVYYNFSKRITVW